MSKRAMAYLPENALNAICPYFTMFPLEYPLKALRKHRKEKAIVFDPFCGRGTTLFAARKLGLKAWGVDVSPVAVAIAKAKLAFCSFDEPISLARQILDSTKPSQIPDSLFFQYLYHKNTLYDICALREGLLKLPETDASVILKAAILGCLHGPLTKNKSIMSYFSNQMPRTYASKPDYAVKFWRERGFIAPEVDVIEVLKRKIDRLIGLVGESQKSYLQVIEGDSQVANTISPCKDHSVVITSPPYYGMKTYVQDQWLRNWFLGGPAEVDYSSGPQLEHGGKSIFAKSLGKVWANMASTNADSLHMYIRFGIIPSAKVAPKELFLNSLEESQVKWRLVSIRSANTASSGKRQASQMKTGSHASIEYDFHVERVY